MSALIAFYRGTEVKGTYLEGTRAQKAYEIHDDMSALELFSNLWSAFDGSFESVRNLVEAVLGRDDMWGVNLNEVSGLADKISEYLYEITTNGIENVIKKVL